MSVGTVNTTAYGPKRKKPQHVAIIMDGNGRWAKAQNKPRIEGHRQGAEAVKRTLTAAQENGIPYITLYAFSVENWNRSASEVADLMRLLEHFLSSQLKQLITQKIRFRVIGRIEQLSEKLQVKIKEAVTSTAHFSDYTLCLALNYGARTELVDALQSMGKKIQAGTLALADLDYDCIQQHLYTAVLPDPDLIIRTSGEYRLSNFLLLQSAYAEIYFTPTLWPDFKEADFEAALVDFSQRERRFGCRQDALAQSPVKQT
ncbi:MAG: polyprenyl diphosphate synthase [Opitutales bacterium]